ncbi:MAG: GAF domain-containing protein [Bacteroidota bacterium]
MQKDDYKKHSKLALLDIFSKNVETLFENRNQTSHHLLEQIVINLHQYFSWTFAWWEYKNDSKVGICLKQEAIAGEVEFSIFGTDVITKSTSHAHEFWQALSQRASSLLPMPAKDQPTSPSSQISSFIVVPMMNSGEMMGALTVLPLTGQEFVQEDIFLMNLVAQSLNHLFHLNGNSSNSLLAILGAQTDSESFDQIIEAAMQLLKAKGAVLYIKSPKEDSIVAQAVKGINIKKGYSLKFGEGMAGFLMTSDLPYLLVHDFQQSPYFSERFAEADFSKVLEVPLFLSDGIKTGVLAVVNEFENFNENQVGILKQLADQAMLIWEHNQNREILKKQLQDSNSFREVVRRLYHEVNHRQSLFDRITQEVMNFSRASQATLFLPFSEHRKTILKAVSTLGTHSLSSFNDFSFEPGNPDREGIVGYVFKTKEELHTDDPENHPSFVGDPFVKTKPEAMIGLPIYLNEQVVGVLCMDYNKNRVDSEDEIRMLALILQQVAAVLQVNNGLNLIRNVNKIIIDQNQLDSMIGAICEFTLGQFLAQGMDIHIFRGTGKNIEIDKSIRAPFDPHFPKSRFGNSPHSLVKNVIERDTPLVIPDIAHYKGDFGLNPDITEYITYKSLIGLKLVYGKEILGALFLNFTKYRGFSDIEKSFLGQLADQVAIGIKKIELSSRQVKQRDLMINAVNYISGLVGNIVEDDSTDILQHILVQVLGLVDELSLGEVRLYNSKTNSLEVKACFPENVYANQEYLHMPMNKGLTSAAYKTRQVIIANDVSLESQYEPSHKPTNSEAVFPIRVRGETIGVLNIEHPHKNAFSQSEEKLGIAFANLIGVALEHNRMLKAELETYLNISQAFVKGGKLKEMLSTVISLVDRIFGRTLVTSFWIMGQGELGNLQEMISVGTGRTTVRTSGYDQGIVGWVATHKKPLKIADVSKDERYFPGVPKTKSELCLPIIVSGELFGVLNIESERVNAFSDYDLKMAEVISIVLAGAIDNFNLRSELELKNEHKSNLLDIVAHELRGRLYQPSIFWTDVGNYIPEQLKPEYQDCLREIEDLESLTVNLLTLSNIQMGADGIVLRPAPSQDLYAVIHEVVAKFRSRSAENNNDILLLPSPEDGRISGLFDQDAMKRIAANLVSNAIKFSHPNNPIEVSCFYRERTNRIGFWVKNRGPVIPESEYDKIFERRYQLDNLPKSSKPGIGIGLFIAETFCNLHHGQITVDSNKSNGTTFTVEIPINYQANGSV